jgi:hypothetical protein
MLQVPTLKCHETDIFWTNFLWYVHSRALAISFPDPAICMSSLVYAAQTFRINFPHVGHTHTRTRTHTNTLS